MVDAISQAASAILPGVFGNEDAVSLMIGTQTFDSFESVSISNDMNTLSAGFSVRFADKWRYSGETWPVTPGKQVGIKIGSDIVFNGWIDSLDVEISKENRTLSVTGRDRTCDLVDSSAGINTVTEFKNQTLLQIAQSYASLFGIAVTVQTGTSIGGPFKKFAAKQGETVFETLSRAARIRGVLLLSDELGNLLISNRKTEAPPDAPSSTNLVSSYDFAAALAPQPMRSNALIQGRNILEASASYDDTDRFQNYIVKGQNTGTRGIAGTSPAGAAIDSGIERFRGTIVIAEGPVDLTGAKKRAEWEATVRAAKSVDVNVTVQGWRKADKSFWAVNEIVNVDASYVGIVSPMLVTGVRRVNNRDEGTKTALTLTRPDAFKPQPVVEKFKPQDDIFSEILTKVGMGL